MSSVFCMDTKPAGRLPNIVCLSMESTEPVGRYSMFCVWKVLSLQEGYQILWVLSMKSFEPVGRPLYVLCFVYGANQARYLCNCLINIKKARLMTGQGLKINDVKFATVYEVHHKEHPLKLF